MWSAHSLLLCFIDLISKFFYLTEKYLRKDGPGNVKYIKSLRPNRITCLYKDGDSMKIEIKRSLFKLASYVF